MIDVKSGNHFVQNNFSNDFLRTYLTEVTDNIQLIQLKFQTDKCNQNQNQLEV